MVTSAGTQARHAGTKLVCNKIVSKAHKKLVKVRDGLRNFDFYPTTTDQNLCKGTGNAFKVM